MGRKAKHSVTRTSKGKEREQITHHRESTTSSPAFRRMPGLITKEVIAN